MQISLKLTLAATLLVALAACGQKKLSDYDLREAMIGPDSTIEITPGSSCKAQIMRPNPDGPLSPLNAQVAWTLESPVNGVSIDGKSGLINVDKDVPNGTTAIVLASIENGRRVLKAKLHVFTRETNPFVGQWRVESLIACSDGHEMKPDATLRAPLVREHLSFNADGEFWIGLEMNIAAHTLMNGTYEYDLKAGTITLKVKWPKNKPAVFWKFNLLEEGRKMAVRTSVPEDPAGQVCGYIYKLQ
jgi:hypothetical protein